MNEENGESEGHEYYVSDVAYKKKSGLVKQKSPNRQTAFPVSPTMYHYILAQILGFNRWQTCMFFCWYDQKLPITP